MPSSKSFFLYVQPLSGTGHFVRIFEIARILAKQNQVYLVDGGRTIPRLNPQFPFQKITLPPIYRFQGQLDSVDSSKNIEQVMQTRKEILLNAIEEIKPDVLLIEHFPFSKLILAPEIIPIINLARSLNSQVKIVCSLRDICPNTKYESDPEKHRLNVLTNLEKYFDLILVHSDTKIVKMDDYIPWTSQIKIPIKYTGYVSQKCPNKINIQNEVTVNKLPPIIVSSGGNGDLSLLFDCILAWKKLDNEEIKRDRNLIIFLPLFISPTEIDQLQNLVDDDSIKIKPFTPHFLSWMKQASLSICQAGYNTCTNILETKTPAILIPDLNMSDQLPRAQKLAKMGLCKMISPNELNPDILAQAIINQLSSPNSNHNIDLNGAFTSTKILEQLAIS